MRDEGGMFRPDYCEDCAYWDRLLKAAQHLGECHRHAPRPGQLTDDQDFEATWPVTAGDDWCGDFQPRHPNG